MLTATRELRPTNFAPAFNRFKRSLMLTLDEQAFLIELKKLNGDTPWHWAIDAVLMDFSFPKYRQLICELLSQQKDDFIGMEKIIGEKANRLLLKLRP